MSQAALALAVAATLAACGGGGDDDSTSAEDVKRETSADTVDQAAAYEAVSKLELIPNFHMLPATLAEPADVDRGGSNASATTAATAVPLDAAQAVMETARLTPESIRVPAVNVEPPMPGASVPEPDVTTQATRIVATVHTPAQIRAAYGLQPLPPVGTPLDATSAAQLGAGQTIYVVDAYHNPNALQDLNAFSEKFGLPSCSSTVVDSQTALPLDPAPADSCEFVLAYSDASATARDVAPAYNASWSSEIALDIQWAHAIAPLARIVLIEATNSMSNNMLGGVALANKMGPGIVSMSFGTREGSWVPGLDSYFSTENMTYFASTGDHGVEVNWPAASPKVVAVGGTSLNFNGTGSRYEEAWSGAGGGISAYVALPEYQAGFKLNGTALKKRAVSDVSFNADPRTGQYVAVTPPGGVLKWYAFGGTSIAAPQWAGLAAIANAIRATRQQDPLGDIHARLYSAIAVLPTRYASSFSDVAVGANGTCFSCRSVRGFDMATGLGTPQAAALLELLSTDYPPSLPSSTMPVGTVGKAYVLQWPSIDSAAGKLTYSASELPAGMTVSSAGTVSWRSPVAGDYNFTLTVASATGGKKTAIQSLKVVWPNRAPVFTLEPLGATTVEAFAYQVRASDPDEDAFTFSLASGPRGLTVSPTGEMAWLKPVKGKYAVRVTAKDAKGLASTATFTLTVKYPPTAPTVSAASVGAKVGTAFNYSIRFLDINEEPLTFTLADAPEGMTVSSKGVLSWRYPVVGIYPVTVTATDPGGLTGSAVVTVTAIQPNRAPTMVSGAFDAVGGQPFSARVTGSDLDGDAVTFSVSGAPYGLKMTAGGELSWPVPVRGKYTLRVTARDARGLTSSAYFVLTVTQLPTAPSVTSAAVSGKVGTALSYAMRWFDANGDLLNFSLADAPVGMTISSKGVVSWPAPAAGTYSVTMTATDPGGLTGSGTLNLTVIRPNRAPTLTSGTFTAAVGQAFSARVTGSDLDTGDVLTYSMTGAPLGLKMTSAGELSWLAPIAGTYTLRITCKDKAGLAVTATYVLTVT